MDYRAAYILAYMLGDVALLIAAAHFSNGWSVFFLILIFTSAFVFKARMDKWDGEL